MHFLDQLEQLGKHLRIAANDVAVEEIIRFAGEIGDEAARFEYQQRASGHVPQREPELPEAVDATAGDVRQIERGGARPAHASAFLDDALEHAQVGIEVVDGAKRKPDPDQTLAHLDAARDADPSVIEEGAAAL